METKKVALAASLMVGIISFVYWDTSDYSNAVRNYKKAEVKEKMLARQSRFVEEVNLVWKCGSFETTAKPNRVIMNPECLAETLPNLQDSRSIAFAVVRASEWLKQNPNDVDIAKASTKALDVAWRDAAKRLQLVVLTDKVATANNESLFRRLFSIMPTSYEDPTLDLVRAEAALDSPGFLQKIVVRNVAFAREALPAESMTNSTVK